MFYAASKVGWFFATPSNLLPSLVALGLLLAATRRWRRPGFVVAWTALALIFAAGLGPIANWVILPLEERFPAFQDDGRPVDGVIVLGGVVLADETRARGQLTLNDAAERFTAMAALARRYPQAKLVFSGGGGDLLNASVPEAEQAARFVEAVGVAPGRLIEESRSRNTYENALYSRDLLQPKPGERWLLVTSAWHMPRAVGCFRAVGFPVTAHPVDYRTQGPHELTRLFAFASEGLRRLDVGTREWAGLAFYRLTGRIPALFPAPAASPAEREPVS